MPQSATHWLSQSLVLSSDYRIPDPERVWPLLEKRQDALAGMGAHHVLVYSSTSDPGRVMVLIAIHTRETVIELLRSRVFFDWFDAVGVEDIPAVFAGELVERLELVTGEAPAAPEVMVSVVTTVHDVTDLITHVRETADDLRAGGAPMITLDAEKDASLSLDPERTGGNAMGKRYVDDGGAEVLVTKAGAGTLSVGTMPLSLKEAKPLPASD